MDAATWRATLLSGQGPDLAGMRLVLVALSMHMERAGKIKVRLPLVELTTATKLARPTVMNHLRNACAERWLERRRARGFGRAWQTYEYEARVPWSVRFHAKRRGQGAEARR